jgi:hypothetical protein
MESRTTLERGGLRTGSQHSDFRNHSSARAVSLESPYRAAIRAGLRIGLCAATLLTLHTARATDLTEQERVEILRGLDSEFATVADYLPRSKKPLDFNINGSYDRDLWAQIGKQNGPAARVGDQIQVTRVTIEKDRLILEINNGIRGGGHWYDHVQGGMGGVNQPIYTGSGPSNSNAASGTYIQLLFHGPVTAMKATEIKEILRPILKFDQRSASEIYSQQLKPEVQKAISDKKARVGMTRDEVFLALGRPERKLRETKDGVDTEDWIFGRPPGKMVFVTFEGSKVSKVKETYAGLGAEASAPLEVPHE